MIIYKITNLINNKIYIGLYTGRDFQNYWGSGKHIKSAIKKYGKDNFKKDIIEELETKQELREREIYWISKLDSTNPLKGYNVHRGGQTGGPKCNLASFIERHGVEEGTKRYNNWCFGGDRNHKGMLGKHHKEESKQKISESERGKIVSKETRLKISLSTKGKKKSPRTKEHQQHLNESRKGFRHSEETKKKLSEIHKGKAPWNKGLTKETDERVLNYSKLLRKV